MTVNHIAHLLLSLLKLTAPESKDGRFLVTLEYDNYHDGALVKDGDGKVIGECYEHEELGSNDPERTVELQFLKAIERAVANREGKTAT